MPETREEIEAQLRNAVTPGYRERLLDRGLARGLIWIDGNLPETAPRFDDALTEDLLDYAFGVFSASLRLKATGASTPEMIRGFVIAGEAIEAAVHRGNNQLADRGFNRLSASVAFHLAGYAARAYSVLPASFATENLTPSESAIFLLLRRRLDQMLLEAAAWLGDGAHSDSAIAERLREEEDFEAEDAIDLTLTGSIMRGLALFDHSLLTGAGQYAQQARERLRLTAETAKDLNATSHWWVATLAYHLISDLWDFSLHSQIPELPPDAPNAAEWNYLRWAYIHRLRFASKPALELWPSQLEAAKRILDLNDDLVVALPTSGGKTRIAEMAILRALAADKRVIYVTPLRALSAQIERDLASIFVPLGVTVSALYGATGIESGDADTLKTGKIVVATPEKLDFALRNDATLIDNVGLIVLDEGHMLGPDEREVRYEALVQRLLRRADAPNRRIICLSALFPNPEEMADLVAWIRQDEAGNPVYSSWRPTRQRFCTLNWHGQGARLDAKVENEQSYVRNFIVPTAPPPTSRRRTAFPHVKNELTLAAAWRFIEQKKDVMIYCALRTSVETLGEEVLDCIRQGVLLPLSQLNDNIRHAMRVGSEWLGADHPAVRCLEYGVALHHGGLPRAYLAEVESLLRKGDCRLTIASPTLAQGLNLSASVLLVPSIWRNQKIIPVSEFANVSGRAGRAFVDLEGLVVHVLWNGDAREVRNWNNLVDRAKAPAVRSGILTLAAIILDRLAIATGNSLADTLEYVTGQNANWAYVASMNALPEQVSMNTYSLLVFLGDARPETVTLDRWEAYLASLDAALFGLLDSNTDANALQADVETVLEGSLFARQIEKLEPNLQAYLKATVLSRAQFIWAQSTQEQRKGYHFAGIGLTAGKFLHLHLEALEDSLLTAEVAVADDESAVLANAVLQIARLVFTMAPFKPKNENLPENWENALRAWLSGAEASRVIEIGGEHGVDMLQDAFTYRLPWAMEAIRVVGKASGTERSDLFDGKAAMAVEAGSSNQAVITLVRSGLASREAAAKAVEDTDADFDNHFGMTLWLQSDEVRALSRREDWPTDRTRTIWLNFIQGEQEEQRKTWTRTQITIDAQWLETFRPTENYSVSIFPFVNEDGGEIFAPDLSLIGRFTGELALPKRYIVDARIGRRLNQVVLLYFGPQN